MKIIDAFTFFNAVDVLKMRMELHDKYVDRFYICEANVTYSGQKKDYIFEKNIDVFAKWAHKITYTKWGATKFCKNLDFSVKDKELNYNFDTPGWLMEFRQRNELKNQIKDLEDNDVVIISDMDEFVDPEVLNTIRLFSEGQAWEDARLFMANHYYYMNCVLPGKPWMHPFVCKGKKFKALEDISRHRHSGDIYMHFPNAGWHFSYLGGLGAVMEKIAASSHTEWNREEINNAEYQKKCIEFGIGPSTYKKEFKLQNCEFYFVALGVYPEAIRKIMLDNPRFVRLSLA
jgi:beta-1,4-mannosyl-glycoprotein beta-1,4-N-acetylglucosaminyltransferase